MRTLRLLLFVLFAAFCSPASAQLNIGNPFYVAGVLKPAAAGGGGCTTGRDSNMVATSSSILSDDGNLYMAQKFTAGASTTICAAMLRMSEAGTATGTMTVSVYSDSANTPGTLIDESDTLGATTPGATEGDVNFTSGLSAAITSGTAYWVVLKHLDGVTFDGNGVRWFYSTTTGSSRSMVSDNGTTWSEVSPNNPFKFQLFSN